MATIAKGMITLVNVNDAYSVSVTPSACAIKADFDGTNPVLDDAFCDISVVRGDAKVPFEITSHRVSNNGIAYTFSGTSVLRRVHITDIPSNALSGNVEIDIATEDEFVATVIFQYSVTRESTMLDWIKDWETNKTTIGNTYLITPKLFVGKKEIDGSLTGVYIGPSFADYIGNTSPGLFGYKEGQEIFHIDENGGSIGGWVIEPGGIHTADNKMQILSEGSIISRDDSDIIYALYKSGEAVFAKGNVIFHSDGSAYFNGEIEATIGRIGGWSIGKDSLRSTGGSIELDSNHNAITIYPSFVEEYSNIYHTGGVRLYYTSSIDYGIIAYLPEEELNVRKTFQLGSTNMIAGWHFDNSALYIGDKVNTLRNYTGSAGAITIGTSGIRGNSFYIDHTGEVSFCHGAVQFNTSSGMMVGWTINHDRLATTKIAMVSDDDNAGIYISVTDEASMTNRNTVDLANFIETYGGIYMRVAKYSANLAAYDQSGKRLFELQSYGINYIAGWRFNGTTLYTGEPVEEKGKNTKSGEITIGPSGIRGYKWRLENDGSGAIAGDNITWNEKGEITFSESVSLNWINGINNANELASRLAQISRQMAYGKMLYRDPEFEKEGNNGVKIYPFNNVGGTITWTNDSTAPNTTQKILRIVSTKWHAYNDWRLAGFYFSNQSRANAKFVVRIIAKIPVDWEIENYHNQYGNGSKTEWLTSQQGTGEYEEYMCLVTCGSNGTFSTINHFALRLHSSRYTIMPDSNNEDDLGIYLSDNVTMRGVVIPSVTMDVAYATVIDISSSDKLTTSIDINGIYTGTLRADQIIAGEVDVNTITAGFIISNGDAWALLKDGSGWLANKNIKWNADGSQVEFTGKITAKSGFIGGFNINESSLTSEGNILRLYPTGIEFRPDSSSAALIGAESNVIAAFGVTLGAGTSYSFACGGQFGASGAKILNAAIDITRGVFSGYVPVVTEFSSSITIVCDNNVTGDSTTVKHVRSGGVFIPIGDNSLSVTLPNSPANGTMYKFIKTNRGNTVINCQGTNKISVNQFYQNAGTSYTLSSYGSLTLIYSGGYWYGNL